MQGLDVVHYFQTAPIDDLRKVFEIGQPILEARMGKTEAEKPAPQTTAPVATTLATATEAPVAEPVQPGRRRKRKAQKPSEPAQPPPVAQPVQPPAPAPQAAQGTGEPPPLPSQGPTESYGDPQEPMQG